MSKISVAKNILLGILISIGCISCDPSLSSVCVDNPLNTSITFSLDNDSTYQLDSFQNVWLRLPVGDHELSIKGKKIPFKILTKTEYILNPTQSVYVMEEHLYTNTQFNFTEAIEDSIVRTMTSQIGSFPYDTILIGEILVEGNLKADSSVLIKKIWHYSLGEELPYKVELEKGDMITKISISRISDFLTGYLSAQLRQ